MAKMNMRTIIGILVLLIFVLCVMGCKANKTETKNEQERNNMTKSQQSENPYTGLRNQALTVTSEQLGLDLKNDNDIYGLAMDWTMDDAIVTVVAFKTGDASVYLSSGGGFIGGHSHDSVVTAARRFIETAPHFIKKARHTASTVPPAKGKTGFYILTKSGRYYIEDNTERIENNQSELTALFAAANDVITAYRQISDKK